MKLLKQGGAILLGLSTSLISAADVDFARAKKDVTVMAQILKSAFKSDDRRNRGVSVDGNYLADQGAVFTVQAPRGLRSFSFRFGDGGEGSNYVFYGSGEDSDDLDDIDLDIDPVIPPVPPAMINGIMDDAMSYLNISGLEGLRAQYETNIQLDRESRAAVRDVAREIRELEREQSEYRIQLIHAEDSERKDLQKEVDGLNKQVATLESKRKKLEETLEAERKKVIEQRAALKEKALAAQKAQIAMYETTILQALCDYGSTLKNLPDKEHISVVLEQVPSTEERQIYVFDKKEVTECHGSAADLAGRATKYMF